MTVDNQRLRISVCTYKTGAFDVILIDPDTGEEITLSGKQEVTEEELTLLDKLAPSCVWTDYTIDPTGDWNWARQKAQREARKSNPEYKAALEERWAIRNRIETLNVRINLCHSGQLRDDIDWAERKKLREEADVLIRERRHWKEKYDKHMEACPWK